LGALNDPLVGRTIAQYDILARVGGGAMGVVYQARDTKLGRLVALKFLPQQWSHDEAAKQRFVREAQAASATHHPNICTIHDIETADDGQLFIVMAFYEGTTLKQRLESGPVALDEALEIATQLADGLAKAHAQGVVHRDIKPGNIMLTEDGVRILDFGLATFVDALKLTAENASFGTPAYMSPEQVRGEAADARSDVWAVGVVLYEMLAGHVPFQGSHPEAIAHAIRHVTPAALRRIRPEVPEGIEQLVFRAMHREAAIRFQSGRELARQLRHMRGLTLPVTEPVSVPSLDRPRRSRRLPIVAAMLSVVVLSLIAWLGPWRDRASATSSSALVLTNRASIVVAPVINETGFSELNAYRLPLSYALMLELSDSPNVRLLPHGRVMQALRRFIVSNQDVSSREALDVLSRSSGVRYVVVPTIVYEDRSWRARIDVRDADTAATKVYETEPMVSVQPQETAFTLMRTAAKVVQDHFTAQGAGRPYVERPVAARLRTLDAVKGLEEGVAWVDAWEYGRAFNALEQAATEDAFSPLAFAWLSRAAQLSGNPIRSREAAEKAASLLNDQTPFPDALFISAVVAEVRRDYTVAETRYRDLIARYADDPQWLMELGGFLDRRSRPGEAVDVYHRALKSDERLTRAHLELCRLYVRINELARAREHGTKAMAAFEAIGDRGFEGLARFCLADTLRGGGETERDEARQHAARALEIFAGLGYPFNLPRAHYYYGLVTGEGGKYLDAIRAWEQAAALAAEGRNAVLEPILLVNLGVAYERLANASRASELYARSADAYRRIGEESRAAQLLANSASLRLEYGDMPEQALRELQNAEAVFQQAGDEDFQVFCVQNTGAYYRDTGKYADAERELKRALAIAQREKLEQKIASVSIELARLHLERGEYIPARDLLSVALRDGTGRYGTQAHIRLGQVYTRLADFDLARRELAAAATALDKSEDTGMRVLLNFALGETAYMSSRTAEARSHFERASKAWTDQLPETPSVEARAFAALLGAPQAGSGPAIDMLRQVLEQARRMGRVTVETRARVFVARLSLERRRYDDALDVLKDVQADDLGPELRAQVQYWKGQVLLARGERAAGSRLIEDARKTIEALRLSLPDAHRVAFTSRGDVRELLQ
jgi:serine/threonine protein kinase/tetratricopeptide (TPR) repeat protein